MNFFSSRIRSRAFGFLFVIGTSLAVLISCSSSDSTKSEVQQKEAQFYCPMHPHITSDREGTCPICGMDLVPMENSDESAAAVGESHSNEMANVESSEMPSGHGAVTLNLNKRQLIGVKTEEAKERELFKKISAAGRVAFDPELYTVLGEYREALRQKQLTSKSSIADVRRNTERMIESARTRLRIMGLSDSQIKSITANTKLTDELLLPGGESQVWIYADVYEMDLHNVREGLKVEVTGAALEGKTLEGEIFSVDEIINPETRTAKVRVRLNTQGVKLRPESFLNVTILSDQGKHMSVSNEAVFDTGKQTYVFVDQGQGHFEPRTVELRFYAGDYAAIGSGLNSGEKVVTSGNFLIDSESRLKAVVQEVSESGSKKKTPDCPPGEEWHEQMNHCMKKVSE